MREGKPGDLAREEAQKRYYSGSLSQSSREVDWGPWRVNQSGFRDETGPDEFLRTLENGKNDPNMSHRNEVLHYAALMFVFVKPEESDVSLHNPCRKPLSAHTSWLLRSKVTHTHTALDDDVPLGTV